MMDLSTDREWPDSIDIPPSKALERLLRQSPAGRRVGVRVYPSVFHTRSVWAEFPVGLSIDEGLYTIGLRPVDQYETAVYLGDVRISMDYWQRILPAAGMILTVRRIPRGRTVRAILITVAAIAAAVVGQYYAPALIPAAWGAGAASVASAVGGAVAGAATTLALNALIPLRAPMLARAQNATQLGGGSAEQSRAFSLSGAMNDASPWGPIPVHFGRNRYAPGYGAVPYTEIVGNDQYLRLLYIVGIGPLVVDQPRIGDTPLFEFQDVQMEIRGGYYGDAPLSLYPGLVEETPLNVELTAAVSWQQRVVGTPSDEISIDLTFPQGLGRFNSQTGQLNGYQVIFEAQYMLVSGGPWIRMESTIAAKTFWAPSIMAGSFEQKGRIWLSLNGQLEMAQEGIIPAGSGGSHPPLGNHYPLYRFTVTNSTSPVSVVVWGTIFHLEAVTDGFERRVRLALTPQGQLVALQNDAVPLGTGTEAALPAGYFPLYRLRVVWSLTGAPTIPVAGTIFWPPFADQDQDGTSFFKPFRISLSPQGQWHIVYHPNSFVSVAFPPAINDIPPSLWPPAPPNHFPLWRGATTATGIKGMVDERGPNTTGFNNSQVGPGAQLNFDGGMYANLVYNSTMVDLVDERGSNTSGFDIGQFGPGTQINLGSGNYMSTVQRSTVSSFIDERSGAVSGFDATTNGLQINLAGGTFPSTDLIFDAAQTGTLRRTITRTVPRGDYVIQVRRITGDTGDTSIIDDSFWTAIRGFRWETPIHSPVPLCLIALRIRASEQISGTFNNFNVLVTAANTRFGTRNPASAFCNTLQGPGHVEPYSDDRLDIPSLSLFAYYCDVKGWTFDMVRDFRASIPETLQDICAAGRATLRLTNEGKWGVVIDEIESQYPPVQHFTPRNSWGFEGARPSVRKPHGWRVRFLNEQRNWQQDEIYVFREGYNEANATLYEQIEFPGITSHYNVWRHGRIRFAEAQLQPEEYTFLADWEALICQRGQHVRLNHDIPLWGLNAGRVTGISGNIVVVDETIAMLGPPSRYGIRFRLSDGRSLLRECLSVAGEFQGLTLVGFGEMPVVGDLFQFGELGSESVDLIVKRIEPGPDYSARFVCVDANAAIHTADVAPIPPWDPHTTQPIDFRQLPPPAPRFVSIDSNSLSTYVTQSDGSVVRSILVTFVVDAHPDVGPGISHYEGAWREVNETTWHSGMIGLAGVGRILSVHTGQTYHMGVRTVSVYGKVSNWTEAFHTVQESTLVPGALRNVKFYSIAETVFLTFDPPAEGVFAISHAEAKLSITPDFLGGSSFNLGYTTKAQAGPFNPGTQLWVWVRAVTVFGIGGPWTPHESTSGVMVNVLGLPSTPTQFPGSVRAGVYSLESLIAVTNPIQTSYGLVEYLRPCGTITVNVDALTSVVIWARQVSPDGPVVGSAVVTNITGSTITTPVSLVGIDSFPDWGEDYMLTAYAVNASGAILPLSVRPESTFAMVHTPVTLGGPVEVNLDPTLTGGTFTGETVIGTSPTIIADVAEGILLPQAWINVQISALSLMIFVVRQTSILGEIIGGGFLYNPRNVAISIRVDVSGLDLTPLWGGVYVLTARSIDGNAVANAYTIQAGGGFRMVHRQTDAPGTPAVPFHVYPSSTIIAGGYFGTYSTEAVIASFGPLVTFPQVGHVTLEGVLIVQIPAQSMLRFVLRQGDLKGDIVGSVVISNPTSSSQTLPVVPKGYDSTPAWGQSYIMTGICINAAQAPIAFTIASGSVALLHAKLA